MHDCSGAPARAIGVRGPVGGKTGTTDDTRAAWFVGITPDLAAAAFIADPDNPFHFAGDGNSPKPINAVSGVLRRGLAGVTPHGFTPPSMISALVGPP
jgi:membrane peptidoglycan carboxypeptidase